MEGVLNQLVLEHLQLAPLQWGKSSHFFFSAQETAQALSRSIPRTKALALQRVFRQLPRWCAWNSFLLMRQRPAAD